MRGFVVPTVRYRTCCHLLQSSWNNWTAGTCRSRSCDQIAFYTRWKLPVYNQWARRDDGSRDRELVLSLLLVPLDGSGRQSGLLASSFIFSIMQTPPYHKPLCENEHATFHHLTFLSTHPWAITPCFCEMYVLSFFYPVFFFLKDRLARRPYQPYLIIGTIPLNSSPIQKLQRANSPF